MVGIRGYYYADHKTEKIWKDFEYEYVMLVPRNKSGNVIIMEFKVRDPKKESSLEDTVNSAHRQIEDMKYDSQIMDRGFEAAQIKHYGFAFDGKNVLIK